MDTTPGFRLLSYNVQCFGVENEISRNATMDVIVGSDASLILLQETNVEWQLALEGFAERRYMYRGVIDAGTGWPGSAGGMLIYSEHVLVAHKRIAVRDCGCEQSWFDAWFGVFEIGSTRVGVVSVHLRPPFSDEGRATLFSMGQSSPYRLQEMRVILEQIAKVPEWSADLPLIIAGDFNESDSHDLCKWLRGPPLGLCDALSLHHGHTHWWPVVGRASGNRSLVLRNRLDHVFFPPSQMRVSKVRVIDNEGVASDHLPVICDFHFEPHNGNDIPLLPWYVYTGPSLGWRTLAADSIWTAGRTKRSDDDD